MTKRQNNYPAGLDWKLRNPGWLARQNELERRRRQKLANEQGVYWDDEDEDY